MLLFNKIQILEIFSREHSILATDFKIAALSYNLKQRSKFFKARDYDFYVSQLKFMGYKHAYYIYIYILCHVYADTSHNQPVGSKHSQQYILLTFIYGTGLNQLAVRHIFWQVWSAILIKNVLGKHKKINILN